jgi:ABC-type transport system substrate-binding protein
MLRFFITAGGFVALLSFSPVLFLSLGGVDDFSGKTVHYSGVGAKIKSMDPATCGDTTSATVQGQIYESFYGYHYLKRPVEVIPQLAAEMPHVSEDGLTYTIRLKDGIFYARNSCFGADRDGRAATRAVRADDFVLAFKRIADFHIASPLAWSFLSGKIKGLDDYRAKTKSYLEGDFDRYKIKVEGVRAIDNLTIQLQLTAPFPQLLNVLAMHNYAPIPHEVIDYYLSRKPLAERNAIITEVEQAVGTGAYRLTTWEKGSRLILERNEEYRHGFYPESGESGDREAGLLADAGNRLPFIDVIYMNVIEQPTPGWLRFHSRQSDFSGVPRDVFDSVISPSRELTEEWSRQGITLGKYGSPVIYWLVFNMEDPLLKASPSLRQAMCLSYSVEDEIQLLRNGRGKRAINILPSSFPTHGLAGPGPYFRYDPEAAREKLKQARSELAVKDLLDKDGRIPEISVDLGSRESRRRGEFIKQQFSEIGLNVKIKLNDWPTLQEKVHTKRCQLFTMGWHADYPDGENFLQLFYGPNIAKGTNNSNYSNPKFDALYEQAKVMPDSPERRELYAKMVRMIGEDCPLVLLSEPLSFVLKYDWVKNYKPHPFGYGNTKHLRIDTDLRRRMGGP